jgi:hypothetical protein
MGAGSGARTRLPQRGQTTFSPPATAFKAVPHFGQPKWTMEVLPGWRAQHGRGRRDANVFPDGIPFPSWILPAALGDPA